MIDTIFYFVDSLNLDDYITLVLSGEIASKTIVFASLQKSIYKGGKLFGRMLYEDLKTELEKLFNNEDSPAAKRYIEKLIGLHPYDDAALRDAINQLNTAILLLSGIADLESARLDGVIGTLDNSIKSKIENLLNTASWVLEHIPKQEITWQAGWDDKLHLYLSTVGYWDSDNEGWTTKYSLLKQSLDNLSLSVNTLENKLYYDGSTVTEAILAAIDLAVRDGVSNLDLGATYAKFGDVNSALNTAENYADTKDGEIKQVIEWMYSGLLALASEDVTFARLLSAGKSGMRNAISEIRTYVEKLKDGDFLATSSVESAVDNAIAGLYNSASTNHASSDMFVKLKKNSTDIAGLSADMLTINGEVSNIKTDIATANLITRLSGASNGLVLKTVHTSKYNELDGKIDDNYNELDGKIDDNYETLAGLINTVKTDLATYEAGVTTKIDTRLNTVTALLVAKSEVDDGTLAASIMAKVNENGSQLTLSADRIDVTAAFVNLMSSRVVAKLLSVSSGNTIISTINPDGTINFGDGTFEIPKTIYSFYKKQSYNNYPGGVILRSGSARSAFDKISHLQIEPPFDFSAAGDDKELKISDLTEFSVEMRTPIWEDRDCYFKYRQNEHHASIAAYGPYFYADEHNPFHTDNILSGPVAIASHGIEYTKVNAEKYETSNSFSSFELRLDAGAIVSEFDDTRTNNYDNEIRTNGLAQLTFTQESSIHNKHCGVFRIGSIKKIQSAGQAEYSQGIRTEVWNGIRIGNCVGEFRNKSAIEIQKYGKYEAEEFVNTLNTVIPYKDDSGNTKYLGIVAGLIVYNGNDEDIAYTTTGISNPNSNS